MAPKRSEFPSGRSRAASPGGPRQWRTGSLGVISGDIALVSGPRAAFFGRPEAFVDPASA
eukprot:9482777-Pyramimonas_sp.AAC.1